MRILIGNTNPIVGNKQEDGTVVVEELPEGEYVTEVLIVSEPENLLRELTSALSLHMKDSKNLAWVESEDQETTDSIAKHYGIKNNKRPAHWGEPKQVEKVDDEGK